MATKKSKTVDVSTNGHDEVAEAIDLVRLERARARILVRGMTPLIVHRFDEKARQMILDKQQGKPVEKKQPKDPEGDYNRSRHIIDGDQDGFPAVGFKAAIADATRLFGKHVTKVGVKQAVYIAGVPSQHGDVVVPIDGERVMREDMVRIGSGMNKTADIRFRAQYNDWSALLDITWVKSQLTTNALVALVDAAGTGGIGEWRPSSGFSSTGVYGQFEVVDDSIELL